jgi:hypothetical protein
MTQLRLEEVLTRDVNVQWFEGVAVVQLICRALRTHGGDGSSFPSAADVVVAPGGSIAITRTSTGNAVAAAAHLLARMFSDDAPVRLRLAVSQATATESGYANLAEFTEQLAYFERPNPEGIVDGLRQRALLAPPRAVAPASSPHVEVPAQKERRPASSPAAPPRRVSRLAIIAAAVSAAACASVWVIGRAQLRGAASDAPVVERAEPPAPDRPRDAHAAIHPTRAAVPSPVALANATARQTVGTSGVAAPDGEATSNAEVPTQLASSSYVQAIGTVDVGPPRVLAELTMADRTGSADRPEDDLDRIYTRNDPNVTLPQNVYPKFPTQSAASTGSSAAVLEVTIAKDGMVEQVKMLTPPRNIHEFMILSVAKAWRFEPARLDGRAIRYRHTISMNAASLGWSALK